MDDQYVSRRDFEELRAEFVGLSAAIAELLQVVRDQLGPREQDDA